MSRGLGRGLGRGFASLIPEGTLEDSSGGSGDAGGSFRVVPLDEVRPNPNQPREVFDPAELEGLAGSIKRHGVLSPLVVRKAEGKYVLIAGERRLRAAALAGLTEVPVLVRAADAALEQLELALVENLQRADLDPIEAARGYQRLIDEFQLTQEDVADRVGKNRATVANAVRLLKLPDFVLAALRDQRITAGHARALLPLAESDELRPLLAEVIARQLSVRATEQRVATLVKRGPVEAREREDREKTLDYATRLLMEALRTEVSIVRRKDGSGRIVVDFADSSELERLIQTLREAR